MPLGIELAATWVRTLSCAEIAEEIERNFDFLSGSARDLPPRHRSLRAVFDQSWALLAPEEQRGLQQAAVFRGGFRREACTPLRSPLRSPFCIIQLAQQRCNSVPNSYTLNLPAVFQQNRSPPYKPRYRQKR